MMKRKILIYQKNENRPISLTEESAISDSDLKKLLTQCFVNQKVTTLELGKDVVILRPSDVSAILITKNINGDTKPIANLDNPGSDSKNYYDDQLTLETDTEKKDAK